MKLIRLYTSGERSSEGRLATCSFNNNFQDNLVLPPFSKLAFLNASIDTMETEIVIDDTNNKLWYSLNSGSDKEEVTLTNAVYDKKELDKLLLDMRTKLNDSVFLVEATTGWLGYVGLEWNVTVRLFKVNIEYKRSALESYEESLNFEGTDIEFDDTTETVGVYNNTTYTSTEFTEVAMLPVPVAKGFGTIRTQIHLLERTGTQNLASNGFVIGFSTTNLSTIEPSDFTQSMITYGLKVSLTNAGDPRYVTFLDGVATTVPAGTLRPTYDGEGDPTNDYLDVSINGSNIQIGAYTEADDYVNLTQHPYTAEQNLYPFIAFNTGSDFTIASNLAMTPSPYFPLPSQGQNLLGSIPPVPPSPALGVGSFNFQSEDGEVNSIELAKFLGYNEISLSTGDIVPEFTFVAQTNFQGANLANSFIVELQNIQLQSYDGFKEGRKNILYFMSQDSSDGYLHFEVNTPQPIDLNNKNEILLRNIRARILDDNYTPILIDSPAYMTMIAM
jgi:hypothetical protein